MKVKRKLKVTDGQVMKDKEKNGWKSWKRRLRWVEKQQLDNFNPSKLIGFGTKELLDM